MLVMKDKRNAQRQFTDPDSVDNLIDKAKVEERKGLFFYRKRIAYDQYLIQLWDWHPVNELQKPPRIVWEIEGVTRKHIKAMREFPQATPTRPIIKDGQPVKGQEPTPA